MTFAIGEYSIRKYDRNSSSQRGAKPTTSTHTVEIGGLNR